jgi:Secretion system C-terminal sorting domain
VIGSVPAAGNSSIENSYFFTDYNPLPGTNLYRIAEYDLDNRVSYTQVIGSSCGVNDAFAVWPNPVSSTVWISISSENIASVNMMVYDARGTLVLLKKTSLSEGNNQYSLDLSNLAQGTYELIVDWGSDHHVSSKILKL